MSAHKNFFWDNLKLNMPIALLLEAIAAIPLKLISCYFTIMIFSTPSPIV